MVLYEASEHVFNVEHAAIENLARFCDIRKTPLRTKNLECNLYQAEFQITNTTLQMDIKPRIFQQKWQLEHHNVSNYYSSVPIISTIRGEICTFLFSLNQLRPKLHSKFYKRKQEM